MDTEIQSTPNVMDVRNGGISLSIYQITTITINTKEKGMVKTAQVCFKLVLVFHKTKINILFLALGSY